MKRQIGTVNLAKQATNIGVNLCKYFQQHCALLGGGGVKIGCCCTLTRNRPREVRMSKVVADHDDLLTQSIYIYIYICINE